MTADTYRTKALMAFGRPALRPRRHRRRQPLWLRIYRIVSSVVVGGLLVGCAGTAATKVAAQVRDPVAALRTSDDPVVRMAAYRKLAYEKRPANVAAAEAIPVLAHGAEQEASPIARCAAITALGRYADAAALAALEHAARDPDPMVRAEACRALGERSDAAARPLLGQLALDDPEVDVRIAAAEALGAQRHPEAARLLLPCLDDRDLAVVTVAHAGLQHITGAELPPDPDAWAEHLGKTAPTARLATPADSPARRPFVR